MTYYKMTNYSTKIQEVEFDRVTEHTGFLADGKRRLLLSSWERHHTTREQAVEWLFQRLVRANQIAIDTQKRAEKELTDFVARENIAGDENGRDA